MALFCLTGTTPLHAQKGRLKRAQKLLEQQAWPKAAAMYSALYDKGVHSQEVVSSLARAHYEMGDYTEAAQWYATWDRMGELSGDHPWRYLQSLRSTGNTEALKNAEQTYLSRVTSDSRMLRLAAAPAYLEAIEARSYRSEVLLLPLNTGYDELAPVKWGDTLLFASARDTGWLRRDKSLTTGTGFLDIYSYDGATVSQAFPDILKGRWHESSLALHPDGSTLFLTRSRETDDKLTRDNSGENTLEIVRLKKEDSGSWGGLTSLPFASDMWSVAHPAVSSDGKWLYFASNMQGGYGQSDLYRVEMREDGSFGKPENLGPVINTEGRESFPHLSEGKLYFASDGHPGLGGLDLFSTEETSEGFQPPVNLARPVNSGADDVSLFWEDAETRGWMASTRRGQSDIYEIKAIPCTQFITGTLYHENTGAVLVASRVVLYQGDTELRSAVTDAKGKYVFEGIPCTDSLRVEAQAEGFIRQSEEIRYSKEGATDFLMKPETVTQTYAEKTPQVSPVYFGFDRSSLSEATMKHLDGVAEVMLENEEWQMTLGGHSDRIGASEYNLRLSERRAQAVAKYLINKGIDASRISIYSYGEDQPAEICSGCSKTELQVNRRVEIEIGT